MNALDLSHGTIVYEYQPGNDGQPVIVLHGLGDSSIHTLMPLFRNPPLQGTSALFIDAPGFGESTASATYPASIKDHAEAIAAVLHHLGIQRAPLFGHSMGANIALLLAHTHPALVDRLILAEPLLRPEHSVLATQISRFTQATYVERGHAMLIRAMRQQALRGDRAALAFLPVLQMADADVMYRSAQSLLAPRVPKFAEMIRSLTQPVTLIVGEQSGGRMVNEFADVGEVVCIADAGHSMHTQQPEATAAAIKQALLAEWHQ